ncbi:uncharacterized protein LOC121822749 [Peromyscus maniculatus bairdii]|uniref:uncharacterized protein LOC121822749 n=1 Tax=Peromyscus maniculatus bairdii TaxID=230844 RepID=UPI003FD4E022
MQESWKSGFRLASGSWLFSPLAYSIKNHQPRVVITHSKLGSPASIISHQNASQCACLHASEGQRRTCRSWSSLPPGPPASNSIQDIRLRSRCFDLLNHLSLAQGWRDGSAVKSTGCSSRGPEFDSQQLHGGSQSSTVGSNTLFWNKEHTSALFWDIIKKISNMYLAMGAEA